MWQKGFVEFIFRAERISTLQRKILLHLKKFHKRNYETSTLNVNKKAILNCFRLSVSSSFLLHFYYGASNVQNEILSKNKQNNANVIFKNCNRIHSYMTRTLVISYKVSL